MQDTRFASGQPRLEHPRGTAAKTKTSGKETGNQKETPAVAYRLALVLARGLGHSGHGASLDRLIGLF